MTIDSVTYFTLCIRCHSKCYGRTVNLCRRKENARYWQNDNRLKRCGKCSSVNYFFNRSRRQAGRSTPPQSTAFNCRILYDHYLPTVILIIIGIPSPTHSFTLGLNPSFFCKSSLPQPFLFTARCYASAVLAMGLCPPVCLSVSVCHKPVFY